jgi:hypothetical protein
VDCRWLIKAAAIGVRALKAGAVVWWVAGLNDYNGKPVQVRTRHLQKWGLSARVYQLGLAALERKGLVNVERRPGRAALVTLVIERPVVKKKRGR